VFWGILESWFKRYELSVGVSDDITPINQISLARYVRPEMEVSRNPRGSARDWTSAVHVAAESPFRVSLHAHQKGVITVITSLHERSPFKLCRLVSDSISDLPDSCIVRCDPPRRAQGKIGISDVHYIIQITPANPQRIVTDLCGETRQSKAPLDLLFVMISVIICNLSSFSAREQTAATPRGKVRFGAAVTCTSLIAFTCWMPLSLALTSCTDIQTS